MQAVLQDMKVGDFQVSHYKKKSIQISLFFFLLTNIEGEKFLVCENSPKLFLVLDKDLEVAWDC
jgi:hypothetical protein